MAEKLAMTTSSDQALTDEELRTLEGILAKLRGQGANLPWPLLGVSKTWLCRRWGGRPPAALLCQGAGRENRQKRSRPR